jgi:hypothetical protein
VVTWCHVAARIAGGDQVGANLGADTDELLALGRRQWRQMGDHNSNLIVQKAGQQAVPALAAGERIGDDSDFTGTEDPKQGLELFVEGVISMDPLESMGFPREVQRVSLDNVDNDGTLDILS